jgi:hypothetical protein
MKNEKVSLELTTVEKTSSLTIVRNEFDKEFTSLSAFFNYIRKAGKEKTDAVIAEKKCNEVETIAVKAIIANGWFNVFESINTQLYKTVSKKPSMTLDRVITTVKKALKSANGEKIDDLETFLRTYIVENTIVEEESAILEESGTIAETI